VSQQEAEHASQQLDQILNHIRNLQQQQKQSALQQTMAWIFGDQGITHIGPDGVPLASFADPFVLNLCDMLNGFFLHHWQKTLSTLSEKEFAVRMIYGTNETAAMKQEIAYIELEQ
jgi:hypothetical protein